MDKHKIDIDKCRLCGKETNIGFNIDFKLVPVCSRCEIAIVLQSINGVYAGLSLGSRDQPRSDPTPLQERS